MGEPAAFFWTLVSVRTKQTTLLQFSHRGIGALNVSNDTKGVDVAWTNYRIWGGGTPVSLGCVGLTEVYIIEKLILSYHSIEIDDICFHVKFKGGLSISVPRNKTVLYKIIGVQNRGVFKKLTICQTLHQRTLELECATFIALASVLGMYTVVFFYYSMKRRGS